MIINRLIARLLNMAPDKWEAEFVKLAAHEDYFKIVRELDAVAVVAARLATYLELRQIGVTHDMAVRSQNRRARKIRRLLGYHTTHDLQF